MYAYYKTSHAEQQWIKLMTSPLILSALPFPDIDPIIFRLGVLEPRWYGLGYVIGIFFAWWYGKKLLRQKNLWHRDKAPMEAVKLDDFVIWSVFAVVVGGRLGEVLIYQRDYYLNTPIDIIKIWDGGMSFHGGFIAMVVAMGLFALYHRLNIWSMFDTIAAGVPIGLGLVRIANFINSELWGRVSDVPWAVLFPNGGVDEQGNLLPRHPSQLYEAALEGFILFFVLMFLIFRWRALQHPGLVAGFFTCFYGMARLFVEFFREPGRDFVAGGWLTMGMAWSLPMIVGGFAIMFYVLMRDRRHDRA